jgi:hypothetical protein
MLAALAQFDGQERETFVRVASHCGRLYLDLRNSGWQIVEITEDKWRVIESNACPVRFRRAHGMQALPLPVRGGNVAELRAFLNVASDTDFKLLVSALVSYFPDRGPYSIVIFEGEPGTAKSTITSVMRRLVDPNLALLRSGLRTWMIWSSLHITVG